MPGDDAVYLLPFDPRDPEEHDHSLLNAYYLEADCQGAAYAGEAYAHELIILITSNSGYLLKRTDKRSSDDENLVSKSYLMEIEGDRQCQNSETIIDSTFWETEQTTLLMSDLNKPHTLIWLD